MSSSMHRGSSSGSRLGGRHRRESARGQGRAAVARAAATPGVSCGRLPQDELAELQRCARAAALLQETHLFVEGQVEAPRPNTVPGEPGQPQSPRPAPPTTHWRCPGSPGGAKGHERSSVCGPGDALSCPVTCVPREPNKLAISSDCPGLGLLFSISGKSRPLLPSLLWEPPVPGAARGLLPGVRFARLDPPGGLGLLPVDTTLLGLHVLARYSLSPRTNNSTGEPSATDTEPDNRVVGGPSVLGPRLTAEVCVRGMSKADGGPGWVKRAPGQDTPISPARP